MGGTPVDKVSMDLFKGETCVLLGYSGAGKSTLIDMIVGKCEITAGNATLNFHSCKHEQEKIHAVDRLGYCNSGGNLALIEKLTVWEHLKLVCEIKDVDQSSLDQHIDYLLYSFDLALSFDTQVGRLSKYK